MRWIAHRCSNHGYVLPEAKIAITFGQNHQEFLSSVYEDRVRLEKQTIWVNIRSRSGQGQMDICNMTNRDGIIVLPFFKMIFLAQDLMPRVPGIKCCRENWIFHLWHTITGNTADAATYKPVPPRYRLQRLHILEEVGERVRYIYR